MFSEYSRISKVVEEIAVDEDEDENERLSWLRSELFKANGISTRAAVAMVVAITFLAGAVGFTIGALVFRDSTHTMQSLGTVPQGPPPFQLTYEGQQLNDESAHRKHRASLPIQRKFRRSTTRTRQSRTDLGFPHPKRSRLRSR
jgi:hypothetical protein